MGSCCPWHGDAFSYKSLCSHNPLLESVAGNFDLSREELETMAAATERRKREIKLIIGIPEVNTGAGVLGPMYYKESIHSLYSRFGHRCKTPEGSRPHILMIVSGAQQVQYR